MSVMKQDKNEYKNYVDKISPHTAIFLFTFFSSAKPSQSGKGQGINDFYMKIANLEKLQASSATSMTLIFIGAFLTGLGVYDLIGKRAGAGSIIPITGFANSIVSPAMEFKKEGYVMGVGSNLFKIAGPVLVYGISSSIICGILYYFIRLIF